MTWVTITGAGTTTATKFFGDITNKYSNMFNGVDVSDTVTINSAVIWTFENGAFKLRNPADTFSYLFTPAAIAADRTITLPLLTGDDTAVTEAFPQNLSDKTLVYSINAQTGTTYTTVLADAGKIITSSNGSAVTVTIPPNSSVAYPIGSSLTIISIGVGLTSLAQGAGVTITSTGAVSTAPVLRVQHSSATAIKTATDTWRVVGDIS